MHMHKSHKFWTWRRAKRLKFLYNYKKEEKQSFGVMVAKGSDFCGESAHVSKSAASEQPFLTYQLSLMQILCRDTSVIVCISDCYPCD